MNVYTGATDEDLLFMQMWARMHADGDLETTFDPSSRTPGALMGICRQYVTVYQFDGKGIWFAGWFTKLMSGVNFSMWARTDMRRSRALLAALEEALQSALDKNPVLVGLTRRELLQAHQRLGYHVVGRIPALSEGQDRWLVALTPEWFEQARARRMEARHGRI